jgi:hypothetical protein
VEPCTLASAKATLHCAGSLRKADTDAKSHSTAYMITKHPT